MHENGRPDWTESSRRLRCIGHIINLVTKAFITADNAEAAEAAYEEATLLQLDSPSDNESFMSMEAEGGLYKQPVLVKLKALAVMLRKPTYWQAFKNTAKAFTELPSHAVPKILGDTRWNG